MDTEKKQLFFFFKVQKDGILVKHTDDKQMGAHEKSVIGVSMILAREYLFIWAFP